LCVLQQQVDAPALQCNDFYDFSPSEYGPFSAAVDGDIEELAKVGVVLVSDDAWPARHFVLTPQGYDVTRPLMASVQPEAARCLTKTVAWVTSFGIRDLLRLDISTFPRIDFTDLRVVTEGITDYAFIANIETWGCDGRPTDVISLKDGSVLVLTEAAVVLYESLGAFEADMGGKSIPRTI
jgi:hypothetical protein